MINNFQDFQKMSQTNVDAAVKMLGDWNKGWQAIAAEMSDYTKRSFEEGTATFEKLLSAKSVEQAIEIQSAEASLARPLEWTITMRESKIPLAIQRLGKSYWF